MTNPDETRRVEIKDGEQTVAAAEVSRRPHGATRASLHPASGHVAPRHRAELVDAIVDLPEVRESDRLEATVPLGDTEALDRLRERAEQTETRPAGSTALVDATIPHRPAGPDPDTGGQ